MGSERRRRRKKKLNWPAVLGLVILLGAAGAIALRQMKPELWDTLAVVVDISAEEPSSGTPDSAGETDGQPAQPQNQAPVISLKADTVWVTAGSEFDPTANLTVSDPEDGALNYMAGEVTPVPGTYVTISTVDLSTPGAYVVTASAVS